MRWEPFTTVTDAGPIAGSAAAGEPGPPLLLLHGGPALAGQPTAAAMPRAEVALIPAAGHLPWYEQPGCVAAALERVRTLARQCCSRAGMAGAGLHASIGR
jgi:pimeloyl-ACP methyl ester carboxylesterase